MNHLNNVEQAEVENFNKDATNDKFSSISGAGDVTAPPPIMDNNISIDDPSSTLKESGTQTENMEPLEKEAEPLPPKPSYHQCDDCPALFSNKVDLAEHFSKVHKVQPVKRTRSEAELDENDDDDGEIKSKKRSPPLQNENRRMTRSRFKQDLQSGSKQTGKGINLKQSWLFDSDDSNKMKNAKKHVQKVSKYSHWM